MTAVDAFHMKSAAFAALRTSEWADWAAGFTASMRGEASGTRRIDGFTKSANEFSQSLATVLSLAETFYVSPTMNALVSAAAEGWEHDEVVTEDDFPTDTGWLYIPGGITDIDIRGSLYTTSALTWQRRGHVVEVVLWADKRHDPPALREHPSWVTIPQMTPWHITRLTIDEALPTALRMGKLLPPEVSQKVEWITGPDGQQALAFPQGWTAEEMQPRLGPDPTLAWLVSVLRIMQQPLASVERKGLPAALRKRLMRHPHRVKNTAITVIDFRRRTTDFEPGSGREYSHRFLRRGHWRRQPYKREDGTWDRRRIWIHPTVVGDPDKPLILRNHVNALTR